MDRRNFFKIVSTVSAGAASIACTSEKSNDLIPLLVPDHEIVPGEEQWHPSICSACDAGCGAGRACGCGAGRRPGGNRDRGRGRGGRARGDESRRRSTLVQLNLGEGRHALARDIFHGKLDLDQLFSARPVLGHGSYRGPLADLYMCGAGTHPGGGVTGAPGHNAAREVLKDLGRR